METAREVEKKYVSTGLVKIVFVDFVIHGEPAVITAEAAHCAQDQGQFWAYHDLLVESFSGQAYTRKQLDNFAKKLKLNTEVFRRCLDSHKYRSFVIGFTQKGRQLGFKVIPTILVNQQTIEGFVSFKDIEPIIEEALKQAR